MAAVAHTFPAWFDALYARHTEQLQFAEIRRALQALSTLYVHQREKVAARKSLAGRGKRAAFALFYAPIHYLTVQQVAQALCPAQGRARRIVDVGCGTGAGGAALATQRDAQVIGLDIDAWVLAEARWSWGRLGLSHRTIRGDAKRLGAWLSEPSTVVLAYVVNELGADARDTLLQSLVGAARDGHEILLVEPIAKRITPWWDTWCEAFAKVGGRADTWRLTLALPEKLRLLDKASGMRHSDVKARSLYVAPGASRSSSPVQRQTHLKR